MRVLPATAIAVLSCLSFPGLAQDTVAWSVSGEWAIEVDPGLGNGCFAHMAYDTGTVFRIGFNRLSNRGVVLIESDAWSSLMVGSEYDLRLIFGAGQLWDTKATAFNFDGAPALWMNFIDVDVILDFMQGGNVQIWRNNRLLDQLNLAGSFAAFSEVMRCQSTMDAKSAPRT
jgi:hypothetical protein